MNGKTNTRYEYPLIAEGAGQQFSIFCSCPAGRRGGKFCKHAAALLMGDITNLVLPSDDVSILQQRSEGSPLLMQALLKPLPAIHKPIESTLDSLAARIFLEFDGPNNAVILQGQHGDDTRKLSIVARFKNGNPKKRPLISISYSRITTFSETIEFATERRLSTRPSARPWRVDQQEQQPRTYTTFEAAARAFDERLRGVIERP